MRAWRSRGKKTEILQQVPLFQGLSQRQLDQVAGLADEVDVPAGKQLATAGEVGRELFIILEGTATVRTPRGRTLRLTAGDFVGEMSLIDGGPRSADIRAETALHLLVVGQRDFWSLLDAAPQITRKIMRTLSQRLREAERAPTA